MIQRGNNREPCFYSPEDHRRYLELLKEAADRNDCRVHAYVLMTNHAHLLATPFSLHGISHMMQDLGRKYVRAINHAYRRTGTLWEGRYKASLIDSEAYLFACMRYIELNPVRANMVSHPGEYRWSSYAANAQGHPDALVSPHPLYLQFGHDSLARQAAYRELFRVHPDLVRYPAIGIHPNTAFIGVPASWLMRSRGKVGPRCFRHARFSCFRRPRPIAPEYRPFAEIKGKPYFVMNVLATVPLSVLSFLVARFFLAL